MANVPAEHRDIHREADKREPPMERAVRRGASQLAAGIDVDALELAIGSGDINKVMELLPRELIDAANEDLEELIAEAWLEGNEVGAADINELLEEEASG